MMSEKSMQYTSSLVICCGVSGCGKTTAARYISDTFGFEYIEADDFHPEENRQHMEAGKPLTDEMRAPWMAALCEHIVQSSKAGKKMVMAHSGLRRAHRQQFRDLGIDTLFIHLSGDRDLIFKRMQARKNHYMPASLLDSQYSALEPMTSEPDVKNIDIAHPINQVKAQVGQLARDFLS